MLLDATVDSTLDSTLDTALEGYCMWLRNTVRDYRKALDNNELETAERLREEINDISSQRLAHARRRKPNSLYERRLGSGFAIR